MSSRSRQQWIDLLLASVKRTLDGTPYAPAAFAKLEISERERLTREFKDESGHRRPVDGPFLRALFELPFEPIAGTATLDLVLWTRVRDEAFQHVDVVQSEGPLTPKGTAVIEVWTERELCCLQALWSHAVARRSRAAATRAMNAASWLQENIQPDNATNRPWGIGAFIELAQTASVMNAADLYAETLLHNCVVMRGKPDLLSALILWEACERLAKVDDALQRHETWVHG